MIPADTGRDQRPFDVSQALRGEIGIDAAVVAGELSGCFLRVVRESIQEDEFVVRCKANRRVQHSSKPGSLGVITKVRVFGEDYRGAGALAYVALELALQLRLVGKTESSDNAKSPEGTASHRGPIQAGTRRIHGNRFPVVG